MQEHEQRGARRAGFEFAGAALGLLVVALSACPGAPLAERPNEGAHAPRLRVEVVDPDGAPVAGARVRRGDMHARTDATGHVELAATPGVLRVEAPGFVPFEGAADGVDLRVTLERARDLRVEVRSGAERTPLAGALVSAFAVDRRGRVREAAGEWNQHSGPDGGAELRGLPEGDVRVRVERGGYATVVRHVAADEDVLVVTLEPACAIGVQVYDVRGNPAQGATVSIVGSGIWPPRTGETDASGRATFDDVPPGVYELHARRGEDASPPRRGVEVEVARSAYVSLRLQRGRTLRGRVTDHEGTPLAGAEVVLTETGIALVPRTESTDEFGAFAFDAVLDGSYWVRADAPGHVAAQVPVRVEPDLGPVAIALPRAARVVGVVLDPRDRPVAGVTVHWLGAPETAPPIADGGSLGVTTGPVPPIPLDAFSPDDRDDLALDAPDPEADSGPVLVPSGVTAVTDARGRFVLDGLRPGAGELLAEGGGQASTRSAALRLVAGQEHEVTLVMPDGFRLSGRVVDERGFPIGSVPIELRVASEPWPRGRMVSDDGTFVFEGVMGGAVLVVRPPELPPARRRLEVIADEELEIRLETALASLDVRVFDPEGFPLGSARVDLVGLRPEAPTERTGFTEPDGTLHFGALPAPPWRLRVDDPEHVLVERLVTPAQVGVEQTILLARGATLLGRVRDAWTRAPIIAEVRLDGGPPRATDLEGAFRYDRVPVGSHRVDAVAAGYLPSAAVFELAAGAGEVTVELTEGGSVRVFVVDALGEPAPGALVTLGEVTSTTGDDGIATVAREEGLFDLDARVERGGEVVARASAGRVRVVRGETLERRLVLDARLEAPSAPGPGRFVVGAPVAVARQGDQVVVEATYAQTPLRARDVLLRIEGERVLSAGQARAMLRGSEGDELTVEVRRGAGTRTLRVPVLRFHLP